MEYNYDKEFYQNNIKVNDFLTDNTKYRKIQFKDKIEYRKYNNNDWEYHNLNGPAIINNNGVNEYFINGKRYDNEISFKQKATVLLRNKKLNIIL